MTQPAAALVGRDKELDALELLLEGACAGAPAMVFVTGEPGIGKTSLLAELVARAEQRGCLVLEGRAAEFERELPFGLVVDAFDEYLESLDPQAFNRLASADMRELAGVFPALRSLDPGSDVPSTAAERFQAHRAVRELIERLAVRQPLVLVLDDLHWADTASLELTSHLLRRPPHASVLVAGTFRTGQADRLLESAIDAAGRDGEGARRIVLGPLAAADAEVLLRAEQAGEHEQLYRASGGNPFYMLQLARMGEGGTARGNGGGVPGAVTAAIVGELDALSDPARSFAEAAAVVGDPFELDLAIATAGVPEPDALDALDELTARELVLADHVPRRFQFRHPLVRAGVYESCPPGTRLAAHARAAEALAARGAPASARAHHVEQSARHGDAAAVDVLREAGQAAAQRAPASAARWFEVAVGLLPESAPAAERLELLTGLAGAKAAVGRFEESRAALLESIAAAPDDATRLTLTGACAGVEQLLGHQEEAHARLTAALEGLADPSSREAVELMLHVATGDFYRQDYQAMRTTAQRALAVAEEVDDVLLVAATTAALTVAWAFAGEVDEAERRAAEAAKLVDGLSDDELAKRLDAVANLCAAELYLDRYPEGLAHSGRGLEIAHATGQAEVSPFLIPVLGSCLQLTGRLAEADRVLDEAVDAARLSGNVQALAWNQLNRANAAYSLGDLETGLTAGQESVDITRDLDRSLVSTYAGANFAFVLCEAGEHERAIDAVTSSAGGEELPWIPGGWKANYFEVLTRSWLALGRLDEAERAAERAAAVAERVPLHLPAAMAHRAAAAIALARDDGVVAAERALASATEAEAIGARLEAALARILAGRGFAAAGGHDRALAELEHATAEFEACGAVRYRTQAEHELRKLGRHIHRRTERGKADGTGAETLTAREAEIARLVVDRRTNPEIAAALFLSVKTIETHMRNIFRKLGVTSRVEVARAMEKWAGDRPAVHDQPLQVS